MTKQIQIPTTCPSCSSKLERVNSQLFCNNDSCHAKSSKRVEAFIKKMRIKGLGPSRIAQLAFVLPLDIYTTPLDTYVEVLGEKIGQKIFDEVENSKTTTFATFLSALSIPLIGDTASKKVAQKVNSIDPMVHTFELGIGPKAQESISTWAITGDYYWNAIELETYFKFTPNLFKISEAAVKPGSMGKVCITGKLKDFSNRAKAKEFLEGYGYTVTSTVSSVTDYLVCEDGSNSSKTKKAESLGIPVVSIADLK